MLIRLVPNAPDQKKAQEKEGKKYPVSCTKSKFSKFCELFGFGDDEKISGKNSIGSNLSVGAYAFSLLPADQQKALLSKVPQEIVEFFNEMNA